MHKQTKTIMDLEMSGDIRREMVLGGGGGYDLWPLITTWSSAIALTPFFGYGVNHPIDRYLQLLSSCIDREPCTIRYRGLLP